MESLPMASPFCAAAKLCPVPSHAVAAEFKVRMLERQFQDDTSCLHEDCSLDNSDISQDSFDTRCCTSSSWLQSPSGRPGSCSTLATTCCGGAAESLQCEEELPDQDDACCESLAPQQPVAVNAAIRYLPGRVDKDVLRNESQREAECRAGRSPSVSRDVRSRAMAWLVDVATETRLQSSTLFLAGAYFDRFLAATKVVPPGGLLQLLALACVSLAAKQFESEQRPTQEWLALARGPAGEALFMKEDLQKMEWLVLETLEWRTRVPTTHSFLQLLIPALAQTSGLATESKQRMATFASFLSELSLLDDRFLDYSYSTVATACLVLAEFLALGNITNFRLSTRDLLAEYITLDSVALKDCVSYLHELYQQALAGALPVLFAVAKRFQL